MPTGVYTRSKKQLKEVKKNLALGRTKAAREKATDKNRINAQNPEWKKKVSKATKKAMHNPQIRERHLAGLKKAQKKHGINFKGGNGQAPTRIPELMKKILIPQGFEMEYGINTKKVRDRFPTAATVCKADFAHPKMKLVIELDGQAHLSLKQRAKDKKKTTVLEALGWTVLRLRHSTA